MKKLIAAAAVFTFTFIANAAPSPTPAQLLASLDGAENAVAKGEIVYQLGEMEAAEATDKLIEVFETADHQGLRVMAALSLAKIGDEAGLDVVKRAAFNDANDYVKKMCGVIYVANWRGEF